MPPRRPKPPNNMPQEAGSGVLLTCVSDTPSKRENGGRLEEGPPVARKERTWLVLLAVKFNDAVCQPVKP